MPERIPLFDYQPLPSPNVLIMRGYSFRLRPRRGHHKQLLTWLEEHRKLYNQGLIAYGDAYVEARRLHCGIVLPDPRRSGVIWDYERSCWHINKPSDILPDDPLMPQLISRKDGWFLPEPPRMSDLYRILPRTDLGGNWRGWTLSRLETALREFRRRPEVGYPKFHRYYNHLTIGCTTRNSSPVELLELPDKYPGQATVRIAFSKNKELFIRIMMHRPLPPSALIKCATITRDHNRRMWHIGFQCEIDPVDEEKYSCRSVNMPIGIDIGIKIPIATSTKTFVVAQPVSLKKARIKVTKRQRQLSHHKIGSKRRRRASERLARAHAKTVAIRKQWAHKQSAILAKQYRFIAVEDLSLENMTRSAKGTREEPGKNVKAKSGLNRELLSIAPGMILSMIEWKSYRAGGVRIAVNPRRTSRDCPDCGDPITLDRNRQMHCTSCGLIIDRDLGASRNILARGRAILVTSEKLLESSTGWPSDGEGTTLAVPNDPQTLRMEETPYMYSGGVNRYHNTERLSPAELAGIARIRQMQQDRVVAANARRQKRISAMSAARRAKARAKRDKNS
jgi:transposase